MVKIELSEPFIIKNKLFTIMTDSMTLTKTLVIIDRTTPGFNNISMLESLPKEIKFITNFNNNPNFYVKLPFLEKIYPAVFDNNHDLHIYNLDYNVTYHTMDVIMDVNYHGLTMQLEFYI